MDFLYFFSFVLKSARNKQTNMFKASNESEDITKTSYKLSHLLARNMKPYSDGEIMKQAIVMFATECCSSATQQKAKKLQLSNTTVIRRIEYISNDQHDQLLEKSKNLCTNLSHLTAQKTSLTQSN